MSAGDIDKQQHYGRYQKSEDDRHALAMKMAHKALDIPEADDLKITNANRTTNGLDWKGVALIIAGILGAGGLGAYVLGEKSPAASPAASPATADTARIRVFWGEEEIKPGESRTAEVAGETQP